MKKLFEQEWFNGAVLTIFGIALVMILIGAILYALAERELNNNPAQRLIESSETAQPQSDAEVQGLIASGIRRDQLLRQQNLSMIIGGAGLVVAGGAWLLFDSGRNYRRQRRRNVTQQEN